MVRALFFHILVFFLFDKTGWNLNREIHYSPRLKAQRLHVQKTTLVRYILMEHELFRIESEVRSTKHGALIKMHFLAESSSVLVTYNMYSFVNMLEM